MKRNGFIGSFLLLALLATCSSAPEPVETPPPALQAIDSLMWQQPDSALLALMAYAGDASEYNNHYAQLLTSELLYKNDYGQTNRRKLQQAVAYFDSLLCQFPPRPPFKGVRGIQRTHSADYDRLYFLDARAHYINGVGYYERDSVTEACREYLKALDVMDGHFEEKEMVGVKSRFMGLIYGHLGDLFSEQFMIEPSILCYKWTLTHSHNKLTPSNRFSRVLNIIGVQFDLAGMQDSALYYYDKALENLTDTDNLDFRNIIMAKVLLSYNMGLDAPSEAISEIENVIASTDDEDEKLTRYLTLGSVLYEEGSFDSAKEYLELVFEKQADVVSKKQAATYLRNIYLDKVDTIKANQYSDFLACFASEEANNKVDISQLNDLFQKYLNKKKERVTDLEKQIVVLRAIKILLPISALVGVLIIILMKHRGKKRMMAQKLLVQKELESKEMLHREEIKQWQTETEKLLEERDRQLEKEKKARHWEKEKLQQGIQQREAQVNALEQKLSQQRTKAELQREAFLNEPICNKINDSIRNLYITARDGASQNVILSDRDKAELKEAVLKHYENFENVLMSMYPRMNKEDLLLCQLYLLGLDERQIAVLRCKTYSAIKKHASKLKGLLRIEESLSDFVMKTMSYQQPK